MNHLIDWLVRPTWTPGSTTPSPITGHHWLPATTTTTTSHRLPLTSQKKQLSFVCPLVTDNHHRSLTTSSTTPLPLHCLNDPFVSLLSFPVKLYGLQCCWSWIGRSALRELPVDMNQRRCLLHHLQICLLQADRSTSGEDEAGEG